jgi:quinoprotein glucose dehydrogenase
VRPSRPGTLKSQAGLRARATAPAPVDWKTYGGDLASARYSPIDQINKDNFSKLKVAWRFSTDAFGPRPDTLYSATPLVIGSVLYTTAGTLRTVVALDAVSRGSDGALIAYALLPS